MASLFVAKARINPIVVDMKKQILGCFALVLALCCQAAAPTPAHLAKVHKLFGILQLQKQYETSLVAGFESATKMGSLDSLPEDQRAKIERGTARVKEMMVTEVGWDKVKEDMAGLYAKHFTEAEVEKITKMLDSDTGRLFITKTLGLLPESLALAQTKAKALMPKAMEIMQEEMAK